MPMFIQLPRHPEAQTAESGRKSLDVLGRKRTAVQRKLRRGGLAGFEPVTQATLLALVQQAGPGAVFFDIGAHIGLYSALVSSVLEHAGVQAYAFEPAPETAEIASKLRDRNRLGYSVVETAVSSDVGTVELYLSDKAETSNSLNADFRPHSGSITVPTTTIDAFVKETGTPPHVIKMDVETHEAEVLSGGLDTITAARPWVVCEVLVGTDHVRLRTALQTLVDAGYTFYRLRNASPWEPATLSAVTSPSRRGGRDWLLAPSPLTGEFFGRYESWLSEVRRCTTETNRFGARAAH